MAVNKMFTSSREKMHMTFMQIFNILDKLVQHQY